MSRASFSRAAALLPAAAALALAPLACASQVAPIALLTSSPLQASILLASDLSLAGDGGYELLGLVQTAQGLPCRGTTAWALLNPGADVDLTTTTDFEDLAGPAADVLEFGDQDRALLADSLTATTIFWNGVAGATLGVLLYAILSSDLIRLL